MAPRLAALLLAAAASARCAGSEPSSPIAPAGPLQPRARALRAEPNGTAEASPTAASSSTAAPAAAAEAPPAVIVMPGTLSFKELNRSTSDQTLAYEPWRAKDHLSEPCTNRFKPPPQPPARGTDYNGVSLPDTCFFGDDEHHVFLIGDWGGVLYGQQPVPADHRSKQFGPNYRKFVVGADNVAQTNVARQMAERASVSFPDYVLNVGDNFYWGGVTVKCGAPPASCNDASGQWQYVYEHIYRGIGLDLPQWLGVLGNHDFGGYMFTNGWDQAIAYTWADVPSSSGRWLTPALYYKAKVRYPDFAIEYFFLDTNVFDAWDQNADPNHNLCSKIHNARDGEATCGVQGPVSTEECPFWFKRLWKAQAAWLERALEDSTAQWQVVVTHFPPEHGEKFWRRIVHKHGVDLFIAGHRHKQEVHYLEDDNFLRPTPYLVSGGGGGITSDGLPRADGLDDMYGFMDLTLTKEEIMVEAISHGGHLRSTTCFRPRLRLAARAEEPLGRRVVSQPSLCDGHSNVREGAATGTERGSGTDWDLADGEGDGWSELGFGEGGEVSLDSDGEPLDLAGPIDANGGYVFPGLEAGGDDGGDSGLPPFADDGEADDTLVPAYGEDAVLEASGLIPLPGDEPLQPVPAGMMVWLGTGGGGGAHKVGPKG